MGLVQLLTTLQSREDALALARTVVEARVAACVQVLGPITSVYRWEGRLEEATEFLCFLKAPEDGLEALVEYVRQHHPYDTPEITSLDGEFVDDRYLQWARAETTLSRRAADGEAQPSARRARRGGTRPSTAAE